MEWNQMTSDWRVTSTTVIDRVKGGWCQHATVAKQSFSRILLLVVCPPRAILDHVYLYDLRECPLTDRDDAHSECNSHGFLVITNQVFKFQKSWITNGFPGFFNLIVFQDSGGIY